jgi:hypothetical protein
MRSRNKKPAETTVRLYTKDVADLLLGYLQETRSPHASGIEVKVEAQDLPEQIDLLRSGVHARVLSKLQGKEALTVCVKISYDRARVGHRPGSRR